MNRRAEDETAEDSPRFLPPGAARPEAEQRPASVPYALGPAQGGCGLTFARVLTGIASCDRESREKREAPAEGTEGWMVRPQQGQQVFQDVSVGDRQTQFFQQRFEVFLCGLLAKETALIMQKIFSAAEFYGGAVIGFGFSHPFPRRSFHKGLSLLKQSPARMSLPLQGATSCSWACGR